MTASLTKSLNRYDPGSFEKFIAAALDGVKTVKDYAHEVIYFNCPCSFDIETSSFEDHGKKRAVMYLWAFGLNGLCVYGRTWPEFLELLSQLSGLLLLSDTKRLVCYVHNLGYEFQFMRHWLTWQSVFSLKKYKPVKALCDLGIEFKCSYQLSGYSLEKLGEELQTYKVNKLVGSLDYSKVRHSLTPITPEELDYQKNDVLVVMAYIQETIERDGSIIKIPLTKTGYVRNYCRNACLHSKKGHRRDKKYSNYRKIVKSLTLDPEEFKQLQRAFAGGFTHASAFTVGRVLENVGSFDLTSSYPTTMIAEEFPMSRARLVEVNSYDELKHLMRCYCCLFDLRIDGLRPKLFIDHPLSFSKCCGVIGSQVDNGRIVKAESLYTTVTEQDFFTLEDFYEWDSIAVSNFRIYYKGYLPTDFIKAILQLYQDKTELKGVEGKEIEYMLSKGMLNSCYGMSVTSPVRPEILYDDTWSEQPPDLEQSIQKYNNDKKRFLFYPWGVWVTAYARRNLFDGIKAIGADYVYSDTDSIKCLHSEQHADYIADYNRRITEKLYKACEYHKIDPAATRPKTIKGIEKPLGVWDWEGIYKRFKTLGAKRYMIEDQAGQLSLTVSGLNKKSAVPYLLKKYGSNEAVFESFQDRLYIPENSTGKNTHTYIDEEAQGIVTDYTGRIAEYHELSAVHLSGAEYTLSLSKQYIDYLRGIIIDE